jgi:type VI secretion system protein ImpM
MTHSDPGPAHSSGSEPTATGFYGKLPSLGDFITRRLPAQFVQPWDHWLRGSVAASQAQLASSWLDHYLTSPLWRFALSAGIAGQTGWVGVLMPSVDRVGRYFPLTLAAPLPPGANPFRALCATDWLGRAESIALSSLADDFDLDTFDTEILALGAPGLNSELQGNPPAVAEDRRVSLGAWRLEAPSPIPPLGACPTVLAQALGELLFAYSLWWTSGSERVAPSLLVCQGLPAPEGFVGLLGGGWADQGWLQLGPDG